MPKITLESEIKIVKVEGKEEEIDLLDNKKFNTFNPKVLGLGDISLPSTRTEALATVFDLSGPSLRAHPNCPWGKFFYPQG